jgi:uncharacterized protein (TIGR03118 family)
MSTWFRNVRLAFRPRPNVQRYAGRPALEQLEDRQLLSVAGGFLQTNLVSDIPGLAAVTDPNLLNPWGLSASSTSPFWVSDNKGGVSTLYNGQGAISPLVVTVPTNISGVVGSPTGTVFNTLGSGFDVSETVNGTTQTGSSAFLFVTKDGLIAGWSPAVDHTNAIVAVNNPGAGYTGLAIGTDSAGQTLLYAANFVQGTIDVFDPNFQPVGSSLAGSFQDDQLPAGYAPFNIQNLNGQLYVEYAQLDPTTKEGAPGAGNGFVDVYSPDGVLEQRLIQQGVLNAPWGVALAPSNFGALSNALLVGNFGDGTVNAFDPNTGQLLGQLTLGNGQPFQEDGLWALSFGNGANSGATNTLYFTAGIAGEQHGLFGSLQALPNLSSSDPLLPNLPNAAFQTFSTVPANGDENPYGVAFVPQNIPSGGVLQPGDLLVSNFNNNSNVQGTGSTIVRITANGQQSVFFQGGPGLGLTTALGVLQSGFVIVGNVPTASDGTVQQGSLLILDSNGKVVTQLTDSALLNGPWDLAFNDQGDQAQVFVANVLTGTVTRINLSIPAGSTPIVESETLIASGYGWYLDPNALVVGPTGLAYDASSGTLYVASTADNGIFAIANAGTAESDQGMGQLVVQDNTHLHGPLGLVLAPNGDLIVSNGDAVNADPNQPNELDEFTTTGQFVGQFQVDSGNGGAAFGIALSSDSGEIRFAAVDDDANALDVWTFQQQPPPPSPGGHSQGSGTRSPTLALSFAAVQQHKIDVVFSNPGAASLALENS